MPLVGDLDEIMGCFPHLQKEEEEADRMGWTVQNRRTLLTYLLERAKRGLVITAASDRMTLDPSMDERIDL